MAPAPAAGLSSSVQGTGGLAACHLRTQETGRKIGLRGPASPQRSFRFGSPPPCSGQRFAPGTTTAVPRSPRSPRASSPMRSLRTDGSYDSSTLLGDLPQKSLPAGKVMESFRKGQVKLAWPGKRGLASADSSSAALSPRNWSPAPSPRSTTAVGPSSPFAAEDDPVTSPRWMSFRSSPLMSPRECADASALAAAASAVAEEIADNIVFVGSGSHRMNSSGLAGLNASETCSDISVAEGHGSSSASGHWRGGLTKRTAEMGASRVFPCHLVVPHALASAAAAAERRDGDAPKPRVVGGPPQRSTVTSSASAEATSNDAGSVVKSSGTPAKPQARQAQSPRRLRETSPPRTAAKSSTDRKAHKSEAEERSKVPAGAGRTSGALNTGHENNPASPGPASAVQRLSEIKSRLARSLRAAEEESSTSDSRPQEKASAAAVRKHAGREV
eukprot:TRINITY_DN15019_c0_g1_i1.p1 TRINITY_DN15019_c0_g1~~TRINITY_DN15019_c0_g1_i1.p1  ORF type:complete len:444 (-),score=53.46 TRINITY_DN15019_c0_g1_i1:119-1450(-)